MPVRIKHFSVPGSTGISRPTKDCWTRLPATTNRSRSIPRIGKAYSGRARARLALCDYYRVEPRARVRVRARRCSSRARDRSRRCGSASRGRRSRADARVELDPARKRPIEPRSSPIRTTKPPIVTTPCFSPRADGRNRWCSAIVPALSIRCAFRSRRRWRPFTTCAATTRSAIRRYRQVLGMEPRHVPARRGLAGCLVQLGEYDEALDLLTSHEKVRQDPVAKAWMGHALAVSGRKVGCGGDRQRVAQGAGAPVCAGLSSGAVVRGAWRPGRRLSTSSIAHARRAIRRSTQSPSNHVSSRSTAIDATSISSSA